MALTQIKTSNISDGAITSAHLEASGVTAGSYGSATEIPVLTVDAKGLVTLVSTTTVSAASGDLVDDTTPQLGGNLDLNSNDITGTGNINIAGTVTADGLTVDSSATAAIDLNDRNGTVSTIKQDYTALTLDADVNNTYPSSYARVRVDGKEFLRVGGTGDVSFYEDTGTTPKFFWDASTERLGIGTSNPDGTLVISDGTNGSASTGGYIGLTTGANGSKTRGAGIDAYSTSASNDHGLRFYTNAASSNPAERMRIDSSGNVGIGITPSNFGSSYRGLQVENAAIMTNGANFSSFAQNAYFDGSSYRYITNQYATNIRSVSGKIDFNIAPSGTAGNVITFTPAVTIDTSGNLMVGTTNSIVGVGNTDNGVSIRGSEGSFFSRSIAGDASVVFFNRNSSDGNIAKFAKDGTVAGSIGVRNNDNLFITGDSTNTGLQFGTNIIYPHQGSTEVDNVIDLGASATRFKDLYLSGMISLTNADHYVYKRIDPAGEIAEASTTAYLLLCENAANNDINGTMTMDRTSGLRHACSVDILLSAGTGTTPVGTCRSIGTAGNGDPTYQLVTLTYNSVSYVALQITNPDQYYETTGAYFTGRAKTTAGANEFLFVDPTVVSSVAGFNTNASHQLNGKNIVSLADWTITESGGSLYFSVGGINKMKLDANGNLDVAGNVNSNATIS